MGIMIYLGISIIFFVIMVLINIIKQLDILSIIFKPLFGSIFIFGILFLVEIFFKKVLNVELFSDDSNNSKNEEDDEGGQAGRNVDFVVDDENNLDTNNVKNDIVDDLKDSSVDLNTGDLNVDNSDLNVSEDIKNSDITDLGDDLNSDTNFSINMNDKKNKKDSEEIIKEKIGFNASYEDMAKAIRTTLKRDKES